MRQELRAIGALSVRSIRNTFRYPRYLGPILIFPTLFLAVNTGGAGGAVDLPGFPQVHGFLDFQLAAGILQAALLAAVTGGTGLALDIEVGFTDRLLASPIRRPTIVLGRLAATAVLGMFAAVWFLAIGFAFGAIVQGGVLGVIVVILFGGMAATAFGGIVCAIALKSGTASVVQGMFPLVFVILFVSSAFFPAALMQEPAQTLAHYNPISLIADGVRGPVIFGLNGKQTLNGLLGLAIVGGAGFLLSAWALRARLRAS